MSRFAILRANVKFPCLKTTARQTLFKEFVKTRKFFKRKQEHVVFYSRLKANDNFREKLLVVNLFSRKDGRMNFAKKQVILICSFA